MSGNVVFSVRELRQCILDFVYPAKTTAGMFVLVAGGDRAERLKHRVFQINAIRVDDEFGVTIMSESRKPCRTRNGDTLAFGGSHRTQTYFYPEHGDRLRVVATSH